MSDSQSHPSPNAEDIFAEYLTRTTAGEEVDFEALCAQHADCAEELRVLKSQWDALAPILTRVEQRESLSKRLRQKFGEGVDPGVSLEGNTPEADSGPTSELLHRLQEHGPTSERYKILGEFARGGMGAILRVWDEDLRRTLAMKVVLGRDDARAKSGAPLVDPKTLGRFLEEAQVTGQLDHPGIVPVHELGLAADGRVYFTMRLVKGEDLKRIFEHVKTGHEGWNQVRALNVMLRVCEAMSFAHSKKVIHRDLKPANVMVGKFGEVYVMDWGLARVLGCEDKHDLRIKPQAMSTQSVTTERREQREGTPDSPLVTMDGDVVGTPSYMPPEQARGQLDQLGPWSDVYSLGAMLYHLLTGEMPYVPAGARASQHTILNAVLHGPPYPIEKLAPHTSPELVAVCEKAMSREISGRYSDTHAFASDLRAYLEGRVVRAYETGAWAEARKWIRRNQLITVSLATSLLVLILATAVSATLAVQKNRLNQELVAASTVSDLHAYRASLVNAIQAMRSANAEGARYWLNQCPTGPRGWEWHHVSLRIGLVPDSPKTAGQPDNDSIGHDGAVFFRDPDGEVKDRTKGAIFARGGTRIALAVSNRVQIVDSITGEVRQILEGPTGVVNVLAYSPDGKVLLAGAEDGFVRAWSLESGMLAAEVDLGNDVVGLEYSSDGSAVLCVTERGGCAVLDSTDWHPRFRIDQRGLAFGPLAISADGRRLISPVDESRLAEWDMRDGSVTRRFEAPKDLGALAFSDDGQYMAAPTLEGGVVVWRTSDGAIVHRLKVGVDRGGSWLFPNDGMLAVCFSPSGDRLIGGLGSGAIAVWDCEHELLLCVIPGGTSAISWIDTDPATGRLITCSYFGEVGIWESATQNTASLLAGLARSGAWPVVRTWAPDQPKQR